MHAIMSKQLHQRIALPLLRHVLETFNAGVMTSVQACGELGLSRSRLFAIRKEWLFANSLESKGKIERRRQIWQDRLPAHFARIGVPDDLGRADSEIWALIVRNSEHYLNRETGMTGMEAWDKAVRDGRNKLRPKPAEPWWEYVWSVIEPTTIGKGRRVRIGLDEVTVNAPVGSRAYLCSHTDGSHSIIKDYPKHDTYSVVLFTDRKHPTTPMRPP